MKRSKILITLLLALTAVGCRHDEGDMVLELRSESLGGHKMAVENQTAEWSAGDSVWVNGERYAISFSNGQAKILVPHSPTYNAVFPASIMTGNNQVTLPSEYHYATDASGRQLLNLPMVATSTGNSLFFYHLTGALIVKYVNHRSETVTVDRVTVSSNDYALCGERTISFGDTAQAPSTVGDRSVTIYFDRQETTLESGDTLAVMIPVAPVDTTNQFTVEVSSHVAGNRYTVSNTQSSANAFPRNALGYAYMTVEDGSISGLLFPQTAANVLSIKTAGDFKLMQTAINNGWLAGGTRYSTFTYSIDADIDMSGIEIEPIHGFTGTSFNGNGHTISNLTIRSSTASCALFDTIINATTFSNITLNNVVLISNCNTDNLYISPFISRLSGSHSFNNCTTNISSININGAIGGNIYFGGISAMASDRITLNNCSFSGAGNIVSKKRISFGGFIGAMSSESINYILKAISCTVNNCNFNLNSTQGMDAGGLIGDSKNSKDTISNCTLNINLVLNNSSASIRAGGLIGYLASNSSILRVENVTINGEISNESNGTSYIGTIYGRGKSSVSYQIISYNVDNFNIPNKANHNPSGYPST